MAADLGAAPWNRLVKLCPPECTEQDRQDAADRHATTGDFYLALSELWDQAAVIVDMTPADLPTEPQVSSVTQDGVAVTYANRGAINYDQSERIKQASAYRRIANDFRKRSQPTTPLIIGPDDIDRYEQDPSALDPENGIIEIGNW